MKKLLLKLLKLLMLLTFASIIFILFFYFWGKQSNYQENNYTLTHTKSVQNLYFSDTLSVMTYNIGYLSGMTNNLAVYRPKELIIENLIKTNKLINKLSPDIIGFQEIDFASKRSYYLNQYEKIFNNSDFSHAAMAVNWDKKYVPFPYWPINAHFGEMYSGQAIISKYEIRENKRIVLPQPDSNPFYYNDFYLDRLAQLSWLDFKNTKLLVINVHFEAWDGNTREEQSKIVLDFYREYSEDFPIIILGDFNCNPPFSQNAFQEETIKMFIDEPGLMMCLDKNSFKNAPQAHYTFNSEKPFQKIDYIFYCEKYFNCIDSYVVQEAGDISDHLPVFAELVYKSE